MPYCGQLPTAMFNDGQIRAKDYRRWSQARDAFRHGKHRQTVDQYKAEIAAGGLRQLIWLDVSERTSEVLIGDGHHRAVALLESGVPEFAFHWRSTAKAGWFSQPPLESGRFPYRLLGVA